MDHVRELQGRLFAIAIIFIVLSAAAYPFFDQIANVLLAPLGKEHELVYLTPGGAFSFIIQVCMYVGFVASLPVIIYNVYRFIMPMMNRTTIRTALGYTVASFVLAVAGMLFAYFVSLPAALYFLTGFDLYHINPMLTIDAYFSFIMTYLLIGSLLFQIPLIMLLINGATPLKPKHLIGHQGKIILGSFIIAAIVSPTPDALNQTLLASPMVVMYQVGIVLVWLRNRKRVQQFVRSDTPRPTGETVRASGGDAQVKKPLVVPTPILAVHEKTTSPIRTENKTIRSMDGFIVTSTARPRASRPVSVIQREVGVSTSAVQQQGRRSIDGFFASTIQ